MIVCQFEIGDFVHPFEGKPQKGSERCVRVKMAADLKQKNWKFKSLVLGHLYEDFFHFMIF